jgi:hypothetical protein
MYPRIDGGTNETPKGTPTLQSGEGVRPNANKTAVVFKTFLMQKGYMDELAIYAWKLKSGKHRLWRFEVLLNSL